MKLLCALLSENDENRNIVKRKIARSSANGLWHKRQDEMMCETRVQN